MARRRARDDLTGRQWAVDQIAEWLRSGTGNLVVTGGAGTGKTALVAALAAGGACTERVGPLHAVHLCRGHVIASIDPVRVLADIARQLTRSVPGYAACLRRLGRGRRGPDDDARFAAELTLESTNLSDAYDTVLRLPFQALSTGRGRSGAPAGSTDVVVAVDGLDETPPGSGATGLADMFAERTAAPTPGLRLILTTRSGPPLDRLRPQATVDLVADCPPGIDAIGEYLHAASGLAARWRAAIAEAAAGCPLYADVVCRITGTRLDLAGVELPSGLDALYDHLVVA